MRPHWLLVAAPLLALAGCQNPEKALVGTWTGGGAEITLQSEKNWTGKIGPFPMEGTWGLDGNKVTLTPTKLGGRTIAEVKQNLQSQTRLPAGYQALAANIDRPTVLVLASDGKTLSISESGGAALDKNLTLTKKGD